MYIGDLLFTTPAIRVLNNAYPHAEIDALVNRTSAPVLQHHPLLRRVIGFNTKPRIDSPSTLFHLLCQLRRERYDLAISLHGGNERAALLTGLSGAKRRGGYVNPHFRFLFTRDITTPLNDLIVAAPKHITEIYIDVLTKIGIPRSAHRGLEMWSGEEAPRSAATLWAQLGLTGQSPPVIGIFPKASQPIKTLTITGYALLCDLLTQAGMTPLLFGSPGDREFVEAIRTQSLSNPLSLAGQTSLLELGELVRKCALVVSVDTGPCHIAAARHVPLVLMHNRTEPRYVDLMAELLSALAAAVDRADRSRPGHPAQ